MTQEFTLPQSELTQVGINSTLNMEQSIFMATTDTVTAVVAENTQVEPAKTEVNPSAVGVVPVTDSNEVLQRFVNDELTPEALKVYARLELERSRAESETVLREKWEKVKKEAKKGTIDNKSVEAAILEGHAPEDVTSRGIIGQTAVQVIENANLDSGSVMPPQRAMELLDKKVLTAEEQTEILEAHQARLKKAEEMLGGKQLTVEQKLAILKAHYVGLGEKGKNGDDAGVYNLTLAQLAEKARILEKAGFTQDERREIIESGIAAAPPPPGGVGQRDYVGERNAAILAFGAINFNHPELDSIKQHILTLHATTPGGIDSESLNGYFEQWANAGKNGRLAGANPILSHAFQERLREISQLDGFARGVGTSEDGFIRECNNFDLEIGRAHLAGDAAREAELRSQRKSAVDRYVGSVNTFETGIHDPTLKIIVEDKEAYKRLAFKIVGYPLQSETGDYSLGFYGQINIDAMTNLLQSLSENDPAGRERYNALKVDINSIREAVRTMHELNKYIITGRLEGASQIAESVLPDYQEVLQKWKGVALVERLLEAAHSATVSKDGYISVDNDKEMMGTQTNKVTGEFKTGQDGSVLGEFRQLIETIKDNPTLGVGVLAGFEKMDEWEIMLAYNVGKALFNNQQRKAAWTSQGQVPAGTKAWESSPLEGFNKILNPGRWLYHRFTIGKGRGGMRWFDRVMDGMQRYKHTEGWGHTGIQKIRDDKIQFFELPTMTGVRDWMASWRAVGMTLRQTNARVELQRSLAGFDIYTLGAGTYENKMDPNDTSLGLLLNTDALVFKRTHPYSGKEERIAWKSKEITDAMKADYFRSVFYEPGSTNLRSDFQSALGVVYKIALNPSGGHHGMKESAELNSVKEDIRTKIWLRTAENNPLAIIPYLNKMEYGHGGKINKTFGGKNIYKESFNDHAGNPINIDWPILQRKLDLLNEIRLAKIRGVKRADGTYAENPVLNFTLQNAIDHVTNTTGGFNLADPNDPRNLTNLSPDELRFLAEVRAETSHVAHDMANVKFAFVPFMNDVILEDTDYDAPGKEAFARHFRDMAHFNGTNGAVAKNMDNLGLIKDYHGMVEFIAKFMEGITSVHGDDTAKDKAYPIIEATVAFFRRGENVYGKDDTFEVEEKMSSRKKIKRWIKQQDEFHEVRQKLHKANSEAQMYYNIKALALDRGQTYEAMEDLAAAGLMGHDQEEEYKKRFGGKGFFGFITRMILEGLMRGVKGGSAVAGMELLKRSFKGAVQ